MDGRKSGKGGATGKWCNFAFDTDDAPKKLLALSAKAGIPKERAVISFVLAGAAQKSLASPKSGGLIRIASDIIRLPPEREGQKPRVGHYACSEQGLVLAISKGGKRVYSGDLLELETESFARPKSGRRSPSQESDLGSRGRSSSRERDSRPRRDAKTGALIVEI